MTRIAFTVNGNHKKVGGNPLPKARLTRQQQWTDKAKDYVLWKTHVVLAYLDTLKSNVHAQRLAAMNIEQCGKPIVLKENETAAMDICIIWRDETHADAENVFGSIADALFHNDKHLDGSFSALHSAEKNGKVEVVINIFS